MVLTPSSNARSGQYKRDDDGSLNEELWKLRFYDKNIDNKEM